MKRSRVFVAVVFSLFSLPSNFRAYGSPPDSMTLSDDGLGSLGKHYSYSKSEIQKLFPQFQVKEESEVLEEEGYASGLIVVLDGKNRLFEIRPNADPAKSILKISVFSSKVKNSFGPAIGASFGDVFGAGVPRGCEHYYGGTFYKGSNPVVCQEPKSKSVRYVFKGQWTGPEEKIPPLEVLRSYKLSEIFWLAL